MAVNLTIADLVSHDMDFPTSGFASPDKAYGRETVVFPDGSATAAVTRPRWMPLGRDTTNKIRVRICWKAATYESPQKKVRWTGAFERYRQGVDDLTSPLNFAPAQVQLGDAPTAEAGVQKPIYTEILFTTNAQADAIDPGEMFRLRITRDASDTEDTFPGDAELLGILIYESTS